MVSSPGLQLANTERVIESMPVSYISVLLRQ